MLITNFHQGPSDMFFADFAEHVAAADARWIHWFGSLRAGPFNAQCFADTFDTRDCKGKPQQYTALK